MTNITLNQIIRENDMLRRIGEDGCIMPGLDKLTDALDGLDPAADISIGDVLLAGGLRAAMWCLRFLPGREAVSAVLPAVKRASAHTDDARVHGAIGAIERWIGGDSMGRLMDQPKLMGSVFDAYDDADQAGDDVAYRAAVVVIGTLYACIGCPPVVQGAYYVAVDAADVLEGAARDVECAKQEAELLAMFPPVIMKASA